MKKIIYAAIAAIGLWLSPGCSNEEELLGSGDEAQVSFTVNLADGIQTKAIADGKTAQNLVVGVFEKNAAGDGYQEITGIARATSTFGDDLKTNVSFKLMKGKKYSFIFWAQSGSVENSRTTEGTPYDLRDLQDIKVSYDGATANDENRDAFLGVLKDLEVTRDFTETVQLKRPFAQLNFMVTEGELNKAKAAGLTIQQSSITLSQVAQKLQPLKGTVSDYLENVAFEARNVSIDMNNIIDSENKQTLPTYEGSSETTYYYLATTYFLVAANDEALEEPGKARATLASANMKIKDAEGNGLTANSVPVQWNYRTNIYGPLLTAPGTFMVEIKEEFNDDYNEYQESVTVNAISEVEQAIRNGATTITVNDAPEASETITIPKVVDGDNKNITLNLPELGTSTITIGEQTTDGEAGEKIPAKVNVNTTSADNVEINLPNSTVTLNGGTYSNVTATTADETLIVSDGVTVETLIVKAGNVRIMKGGKVGTITRADGNPDTQTYVYIEDGGILNNSPAAPIVVQQSISTAEGLKAFAAAVKNGNTYASQTVVLGADIDLSGVNWEPVGQTGAIQFMGTFDGQNHTISNLTINNNDESGNCSTGLFGWLNSAIVKNVRVNTANVTGHHNVGVIAGYLETLGCTIENCYVTDAIISCTSVNGEANGDKCGGIVGHAGNTGVKVSGCTVTNSTISAGRDAGQVVGAAKETNVTNCSATEVTVTANGTSTGANINNAVIGRVL